ncbi:hypothetical protein DV515_00019059 [Chloebia gouldiae]|uniref:Uncharacterized protein n=1 Tax=Chloebia gouldiae TaxID=44316 RepID=A0A3L8Q628_CHLGU|nr:hypothetical protein DV515_00019059 [Chloebia gouldiae]
MWGKNLGKGWKWGGFMGKFGFGDVPGQQNDPIPKDLQAKIPNSAAAGELGIPQDLRRDGELGV